MNLLKLTEVFVKQMSVNICERRIKVAPCDSFEKEPPGEETRRERMIEGKEKESCYLRLIPGLCLEDKKN